MRIDARFLFVVALAGCGIDAVGMFSGDASIEPGSDGGGREGGGPGEDGGPIGDGQTDGTTFDGDSGAQPVIYVTTATKLFTFSPVSLQWTFVTDFSATCPDIDEVAVNANGELYGSSSALGALYKFNMTTFACSKIANTGPSWSYAYTFAPAIVDAAPNTLAGYTYRDYVLMDLNGNVTIYGSNGLDTQMEPSGDTVSMGDRLFVSVTGSSGCTVADCLVETNPKTGAVVKSWGTFPSGGVYALGHWGGKIYGFKNSGEVYVVTLATPLQITTVPAFDAGSGITGAGSSVAAPIQ